MTIGLAAAGLLAHQLTCLEGWALAEGTNKAANKTRTVPRPGATVLLGTRLVRFCQEHLGQQVGNGQCSDLVAQAIPVVGADQRYPFQSGTDSVWGTYICRIQASGGRLLQDIGIAGRSKARPGRPDIRPGDVIQYRDVQMQQTWSTAGGGYQYRTLSFPIHTAVVKAVGKGGYVLRTFDQNVDGRQYVMEAERDLLSMVAGDVTVYRLVPSILGRTGS